jgi:type I restriction enzyme S subunit
MSNISNTTLGDLVEFQRGYDLPKSQFIEGNVPVISSNGVLGYHNLSKVKAPGITIGRSGTVGLPHFINEDFFPHNTALFIKDFKGNYPRYIFYLIKTLGLNDYKSGSGVPTMNRNHLHPIKVRAFLDFREQQKIAKVLSDLDAKIELNNKINAELEAMAKTLYDYWFVQFDFPDANGKPYKTSGGKMVWNEELKREIPEGWDDGTFGNYCKSTGGFAFKSSWWADKGLKVVKIKDIEEDNTINLNNLSSANISNDKIDDKFMAKPGNVLIAMTGATVGKFAIIPITSEPLYVNQRVGYFNLGKEPIKRLPFLINSLNQDYFREAIFTLASGAAQPNISNEQINEIQLLIPSKELIEKFNQMLSHNYSKILINQKENQELASLRDWLLPMLMNGQVSVGEVSNEYIVKDDVLGMVAEHGEEYKK